MFPFFPIVFPFASMPSAKETARKPAVLPASSNAAKLPAFGNPFVNSVLEAATYTVGQMRRFLTGFSTTWTALGRKASLFFGHIATQLTFERAYRDTLSFFGVEKFAPNSLFNPMALIAPAFFFAFGTMTPPMLPPAIPQAASFPFAFWDASNWIKGVDAASRVFNTALTHQGMRQLSAWG